MDRHAWMAGLLDVQPGDRILEVGCSAGLAVSIISGKLEGGCVTAIDRSEKMVRLSAERNRQAIERGNVRILHADLHDREAVFGVYNKIFAMNVNAFWTGAAGRELEALRRLLGPDGTLYLAYVPPSAGKLPQIVERTEANLAACGFRVERVVYSDGVDFPGVCVLAKHGRQGD